LAVAGFSERFGQVAQLVIIYKTLAPGGFFDGTDFYALPFLDYLHERSGVVHALESPGIKPGGAAIQQGHFELALLQISV